MLELVTQLPVYVVETSCSVREQSYVRKPKISVQRKEEKKTKGIKTCVNNVKGQISNLYNKKQEVSST